MTEDVRTNCGYCGKEIMYNSAVHFEDFSQDFCNDECLILWYRETFTI